MYKTAIAIVSLLFLANYAHAWVEPKAGDEIPAPINTSSQEQTKLGILDVSNWIKVLTNPFNFNVGVQAPKFCIQKPDGTTSCCPPAAGQDWSACATNNNGSNNLDLKWVWNEKITSNYLTFPYTNPNYYSKGTCGSYDLESLKQPGGTLIPLTNVCYCINHSILTDPNYGGPYDKTTGSYLMIIPPSSPFPQGWIYQAYLKEVLGSQTPCFKFCCN